MSISAFFHRIVTVQIHYCALLLHLSELRSEYEHEPAFWPYFIVLNNKNMIRMMEAQNRGKNKSIELSKIFLDLTKKECSFLDSSEKRRLRAFIEVSAFQAKTFNKSSPSSLIFDDNLGNPPNTFSTERLWQSASGFQ